MQDFNSIQTTCDYEINYHVNNGYLKGEDFTKSGWKCELGDAEKWIVEELGKSGCCGKTGTVCEEGGAAEGAASAGKRNSSCWWLLGCFMILSTCSFRI